MRRYLLLLILCVLPLAIGLTLAVSEAQAQVEIDVAAEQNRLKTAREAANAARDRAEALSEEAAVAMAEADKTAAERAALQAKVDAAEADMQAAEARVRLIEQRQVKRRAQLSKMQGPMVRLVGALQSFARRPALLALTQPDSLIDLVHMRAIMQVVLPRIEKRTLALRREISRGKQFRKQALTAGTSLSASRDQLQVRRKELAAMEAKQRQGAYAKADNADSERMRAYGLGERARDIVESINNQDQVSATAGDLASLPSPKLPAWAAGKTVPSRSTKNVYQLPIAGRLLAGMSEETDYGFRTKGLTILPQDMDGDVRSPAGGRVAFSGQYRSFGQVVILDHGAGWTTLLTGMGALQVAAGQDIKQGAVIGTPDSAQPGITVELRRSGRPMDIIALIN